jgi:diacylglycerol O-acyltransferase
VLEHGLERLHQLILREIDAVVRSAQSPVVAAGTPLDREDAARLFMGTRANPMVVTAVLELDGRLTEDELRDVIRDRLVVHERFRDRIDVPALPLRPPRWREDTRFDLGRHVSRVALAKGDDLAHLASELASEPLDPRHPRWKLWLVDLPDDRSALVLRIHHAIADGVALLGVLFGVSDEGAGSWTPTVTPPRPATGTRGDVAARVRSLASMLARGADAPRALAGRLGTRKRLAWSGPLELQRVRAAGHAVGARVNDVVLACLSGALRLWLADHGSLTAAPIHALVPVTLPGDGASLGNHYVSLFVPLPVHVASRAERVRVVSRAMEEARAHGGLSLGRALVGVAGALGGRLEHAGVRYFSRKASIVASNVPGPPTTLHLAGRAITSIVFASPAPGSVALSASVFSYAGSLRLTISADARLVPDARVIARTFEEELHALEAELGVGVRA